jgi:hypothetical protein
MLARKALIAVAVLTLVGAACGDEGSPPSSNDWGVITDPSNGRQFHCMTIYRGSGYGGGPAMWCYEP